MQRLSLFCDPDVVLVYDIINESKGYCCTVYGIADGEYIHHIMIDVPTDSSFDKVEVNVGYLRGNDTVPLKADKNGIMFTNSGAGWMTEDPMTFDDLVEFM